MHVGFKPWSDACVTGFSKVRLWLKDHRSPATAFLTCQVGMIFFSQDCPVTVTVYHNHDAVAWVQKTTCLQCITVPGKSQTEPAPPLYYKS